MWSHRAFSVRIVEAPPILLCPCPVCEPFCFRRVQLLHASNGASGTIWWQSALKSRLRWRIAPRNRRVDHWYFPRQVHQERGHMGAALCTCLETVALHEMPEGVPPSASRSRALRRYQTSFCEDPESGGRKDSEKCDLLCSLILESIHCLCYSLAGEVEV